jgi:hypothetical protein
MMGFVLILSVIIGYSGKPVAVSVNLPERLFLPTQRVSHGPIIINNNTDFLAQKEANNWDGNGDSDSPIEIFNYRIEFSQEGITIKNVDLYFYIGNCETGDYDTQYWDSTGIKLVNCSNGVIEASEVHLKDTGILIEDSSNIILNTTTVHDCFTGIKVIRSDFINVFENNFGSNDMVGINLTLTDRCFIGYNSILQVPDFGIICLYDNRSLFEGNTITSTYLGDEQFANIGLYTFASNTTGVISNIIADCESAIEMRMTHSAWIFDCVLSNTIDYGIYLGEDTFNVEVEENYLGPTEGSNAYDSGVGNSWDNPMFQSGNYWTDYVGSGYYYIPGSAGSIDHFPRSYIPTTSTSTITTVTTTTQTGSTTQGTIGGTVPYTQLLVIVFGGSGLIIIIAIILIINKKRGLAGIS